MGTDKQVILDLVKYIGGDGHTIYDPREDIFNGVSKELMESVTQTHKSDGSYKGSIFVDGKCVEELYGVHGLELLWKLAINVEADTKVAASKMGRGFQAQALSEAIFNKLGENI